MKSFYTESGRMALTAYLNTIKTKREYVVIPSLSCIGVVQAIRSAGFIPYYVKVDDYFRYEESDFKNIPLENTAAVLFQAIYGGISIQSDILKENNDVKVIADMAQSFCEPIEFFKDFPDVDFIFLSFQKNKPLAFGIGGAGFSRLDLKVDLKFGRVRTLLMFLTINFLFQVQKWLWSGEKLVNYLKSKFDGDRRNGETYQIIPHRLPRMLEIVLRDQLQNYDDKDKSDRVSAINKILKGNNKWTYLECDFSYYSPHYVPIKLRNVINVEEIYDWPASVMSPYQGEIENYDKSSFIQAKKHAESIYSLPISNEQQFNNSLKFLKDNIDKVI